MLRIFKSRKAIAASIAVLLVLALLVPVSAALADRSTKHVVTVPGEDRFSPYVIVIKAGEQVTWTNQDTDDHTVVSNDFFTTTDHRDTNLLLKGTVSNNGKPGMITFRFNKPGVFAYYCRFHSHLDASHQPVAPGPKGGIQDAKGNFGTPMNGIIVVLP